MTQPLFGGIVTALGGKRPGQAMGLNVFALFAGFGVGSLLFGEVLRLGFGMALGIFVMVQALATALSIGWFSAEVPVNSRSEERRVGKECVSTCRYRWSPYHKKKKR